MSYVVVYTTNDMLYLMMDTCILFCSEQTYRESGTFFTINLQYKFAEPNLTVQYRRVAVGHVGTW